MVLSIAVLESLFEVVTQKSFSQAARKLGKSQSAISTQIAFLEKQLGLKLFDRSKRPLVTTDAGRMLFDFAGETLNKVVQVERYLTDLSSGVSGEVRIGSGTSVATYILPAVLSDLVRQFPKLSVSVTTQPRSLIFESVRRAEVDFGVIFADKPPDEFSSRNLKTERICVVVSPTHRFANKSSVSIKDLRSVSFITGPKGTEYTEMIDRALTSHGLSEYKVALRISNFEAVKQVVRAGLGAALLPYFAVRQEIETGLLNHVKVRGFQSSASVMLIERSQRFLTPTILLFKDMLASAVLRL
jgi:DNA-binding transcriptional LysR family regulator